MVTLSFIMYEDKKFTKDSKGLYVRTVPWCQSCSQIAWWGQRRHPSGCPSEGARWARMHSLVEHQSGSPVGMTSMHIGERNAWISFKYKQMSLLKESNESSSKKKKQLGYYVFPVDVFPVKSVINVFDAVWRWLSDIRRKHKLIRQWTLYTVL